MVRGVGGCVCARSSRGTARPLAVANPALNILRRVVSMPVSPLVGTLALLPHACVIAIYCDKLKRIAGTSECRAVQNVAKAVLDGEITVCPRVGRMGPNE